MNRHALQALAAALVVTAVGAAAAQTDTPSIYGLLDMSVGRFQEPGNRHVLRAESGRLSTSFLGFRGGDDLGGGLHARFGVETYLRVDAGASGRSAADPFWGRTAYVGLQGGFGTSLIGRLPTLLWTSTLRFNPFGDSVGFSPSIRQYYGGAVLGDSRWNNSAAFSSAEPENGNGLSYGAQFNAGEGEIGATGKNVGVSLLYTAGPLAAGAVYQRVRNGAPFPVGFDHQRTYQFGASYEFPALKLYGQAGNVKTYAATDVETVLYQLGAVVPLGHGFVMTSYGHATAESAGTRSIRRTLSIGYDYALSRSTDLYAVLMNEQVTNQSSGRSAAAGVRLRF